MNRKIAVGAVVMAGAFVALTAGPASAQKNYTDGGDLYGGAHTTAGKEMTAMPGKKSSTHHRAKFDPYTDGARTKAGAPSTQKFPDERPQPDDVARSGKFDPYTEGQSK